MRTMSETMKRWRIGTALAARTVLFLSVVSPAQNQAVSALAVSAPIPRADSIDFSPIETEACQGLYGRTCAENVAIQMPGILAQFKAQQAKARGEAAERLNDPFINKQLDDEVAAKAQVQP